MNMTEWFQVQLQASGEGFVWGAEQVPGERRAMQPPAGLGEWTAARHVFHMLNYEQTIALPSMQQWLGGPIPAGADADEDIAWNHESQDMDLLLARFRQVRAEQIALLPKFEEADWQATREAVWGPVTLLWVVSKTYQHTAEHTHDVMRLALFWH
jgi:hypothetical protein